VLEKIGHAEKTIDPATMKKIELLKNIQTTVPPRLRALLDTYFFFQYSLQYSKLLVESNTMVESVSTFVGIHNEMGMFLRHSSLPISLFIPFCFL